MVNPFFSVAAKKNFMRRLWRRRVNRSNPFLTSSQPVLHASYRRAPAKGDQTGGDGDAGYAFKHGQPHYGYKAHVAVDETHTLFRQVTLIYERKQQAFYIRLNFFFRRAFRA
jgi:hypothetical protein